MSLPWVSTCETEGKIIAIGGDAVAFDGLDNLAFGTDVLIQCCYLAEDEITSFALKQLAGHVIATSGQVEKIASRNNVKKLVHTHINPKSVK